MQENEEELNAFRQIFKEMKLSGTSLKTDMLITKISQCQILENKLEKQKVKMETMERKLKSILGERGESIDQCSQTDRVDIRNTSS